MSGNAVCVRVAGVVAVNLGPRDAVDIQDRTVKVGIARVGNARIRDCLSKALVCLAQHARDQPQARQNIKIDALRLFRVARLVGLLPDLPCLSDRVCTETVQLAHNHPA